MQKTANEASVVTSVVQAFGYIIGGIIPVFFGYIVDSTKKFQQFICQMAVGSVILLMIGWVNLLTKIKVNSF